MENSKFAKLARDTKIIGKNVTMTDIDIVFNKIKEKSQRKISFDTFLEGLKYVSALSTTESRSDVSGKKGC